MTDSIRTDTERRAVEMGSEGWAVFDGHIMIASNLSKQDAQVLASAEALLAVEEASMKAFLNDDKDSLLWIGKAEDEHNYGIEFVSITLPKDRYFAVLEALAALPYLGKED